MDKIYSRFRVPKITTFSVKMSRKIFVVVIIILIIAYFTAIMIINSINPSLERQSIIIARATAERLSNEACQETMQGLGYQDLCEIQKDNDGNVTMINLNVINVNKVSSQIALKVQKKKKKNNNGTIIISLGSISGDKVLAGKGPKVEVKVETIGAIQTSIKSEFLEAGINQSLHKIYISIDCKMAIISPYKDTEEEIVTEVLLAESVIVGRIPQTYYNLNGMNEQDTMSLF